jgi:glycosyltransferase involved in cell wall biosynthesis
MGGSQTHVRDLLDGFATRFELTLATGEEGYLTEEARARGIRTVVLPNLVQPLKPAKDAAAFSDILGLLKTVRPDLIHCHTSKAGVLGRVAAHLANVPAVFTAHTWSFADGASLLWKLVGTPSERLAARWTEKIIAVSESNRRLAIEKGIAPAGKIVTVHNGIKDDSLRARPAAAYIPRITMVARFVDQKNQAQLIQALSEIDLPYRLSFVGDGPTRPQAEALAAQLGVADRVEFLGTRSDTAWILADSSIFALATNWEGFPITILEAMRAGLPVVATGVDGVAEAVNDRVTGFVVPKGDTPALMDRLHLLLTSPYMRARMGENGRRRYEDHFAVHAMLQKLEAIYESVVPSFVGRVQDVQPVA